MAKRPSRKPRFARTRKAIRTARRVKAVAGRGLSGATRWIGEQHLCPICEELVPYRRLDAHNWQHRIAQEERQRRVNQIAKAEAEAKRKQGPPARTPSRTKAAKVAGQTGEFDRKKLHNQRDKNGRKIKRASKGPYQKETEGIKDDMTGRARKPGGGGTPASQLAAAVVTAFQAWAEYQPTDVEELRSHLLSMDAALAQIGDPLHAFAAGLVQRRFHPAIAQPIDAAAETMVGVRVNFSEAYRRFEVIYADRLRHEREQQHKPDDAFFRNAG